MKTNTPTQNPAAEPKPIKYLRWGIVLLLTLGIINSYLDRMNMSFAASAISREFGHWVQVFQFWRSDAAEISSSVAIDQDAAILAGEFDGLNQRGGLAYLLTHQDSGWVVTASLQPDSALDGVLKTKAIALDENDAIISSVSDSSGSGLVFIARHRKKEGTDKNQIQWRIQQQLLPTEPPIGLNFGAAVAIRNDYALVGAPAKIDYAISGAVYVFHRQDDHWVQQAKLTVENTAASGPFGQSVAMLEDAVLVGNSAEEQGRGAVYVFQHQENDWIQTQKLMRADAQANDHFGQLLSADGNYALVTAPDAERHASSGTAYIFQRHTDGLKLQVQLESGDSPAINQFGISAALAGNYAMVGAATGPKAGASGIVFMYHREGQRWVQQSRLVSSDSTIFNFGSAVALSDDKFAIVGAIKKRTALNDTLSAYIYKHIPVDPAQMGLILAMFFWMYGLLQVPAGRLVDKYGIRKLYTLSYLIWGFVATAFGLATSIWMFILLRALLGILESVSAPASMAFIGTYFNEKERGLASGLYLSGTKFGPSIGGILAAWLIDSYGWRMLFILCGLVPLIWLAPWEYFYRKLESRLRALPNALEPASLADKSSKKPQLFPLKELFKYKKTWGIFWGSAAYSYVLVLYLSWLPTYFQDQMHFTLAKMGAFSSIAFGGVAIMVPLAGAAADFLIRLGYDNTKVRKAFVIIGFLMGSLIIPVPFIQNQDYAVTVLLVAIVSMGMATANTWAIMQAIAPENTTGTLAGVQDLGGSVGAAVAPLLTGFMVSLSGSFNSAFLLAGMIMLSGILNYVFLIGKVEKIRMRSQV